MRSIHAAWLEPITGIADVKVSACTNLTLSAEFKIVHVSVILPFIEVIDTSLGLERRLSRCIEQR